MTEQDKAKQINRRQLIRAGGLTVAGITGAALIGCSSDDSEVASSSSSSNSSSSSSSAATQAATATPTASGLTAAKTAVATQAAATDTGPKKGGRLIWGTLTPFENYKGPYTSGSVMVPNTSAFWDTLAKYGKDSMKPEPHLAESWEFNSDKTQLQVKLRPGLEFHNGKTIDSTAVKRSMDLMDDEGTPNSQVKGTFSKYINEVKVIDDKTLTFDLAWPGDGIFDVFQYAHIHDADDLQSYVDLKTCNASGPFKFDFDEFKPGEGFLGRRHENHYAPTHIDEVEFRVFQDASALGLAVDAGEVHATNNGTHADAERWMKDDKLEVGVAPAGLASWVLGMTVTGNGGGNPILDDPRVRRAIYRVIDRNRLATETFQGLVEPLHFHWRSYSPAYDKALDRDYFNIEEAKALLNEAGYDSIDIDLNVQAGGDPADDQIAAVIQADAAKAGINFNITLMDAAERRPLWRAGKLPGAYLSSFAFYSLQPETLAVMNYQMRIPNSCAYDTPKYQAIIDGFAGASVEKKAGLIQEMNALYANEPWIAPIVSRGYVWANSKKLKGLVTDILSTPYWSELWLDA